MILTDTHELLSRYAKADGTVRVPIRATMIAASRGLYRLTQDLPSRGHPQSAAASRFAPLTGPLGRTVPSVTPGYSGS
jgi:hypothetical protein